MDALDSLCVKR